jgi:hypothetical protein
MMLKMLQKVFESSVYFNDEESPLKAHLTAGDTDAKVLIMTGPNASGKSFAVRVLAGWLNGGKGNTKTEPLQVSMRYRTMSGMHRAFMFGPFGDEQDSTGSVSLGAVNGGFRTAKGRDTPCWLFLDEPDTGLSEEFAPAMGEYIAQQANEGLGPNCGGLVVVTHSRALVQAMLDTLTVSPHFVHVDDEPLSIADWLSKPRRRSVEELLALPQKSITTFRAINVLLKD